MFRWSYVLPRLVLLLLLLLFLSFGVGPLLRWGLTRTGQQLTGAKVDIGALRLWIWGGQLTMDAVEIADPRRPESNLVQFDQASFQLNSGALLRKRLVVDHGALHGLRFQTPRRESGALPDQPAAAAGSDSEDAAPQHDRMTKAAGDWLEGVGGRLDQKLQDELESPRVAKQLAQRWPEEYKRLEGRVEQWKQRVESIRGVLDGPPDNNVLKQVEFYQGKLAELDGIRREVPVLRGELDRLQRQVAEDRVAIDTARKHDEQYIRDHVRLDKLDPQSLSEYLLGEELSQQVGSLLGWVGQGRQVWDVAGRSPEFNESSGRGQNISLVLGRRQPSFLIRVLDVDGVIGNGSQQLSFAGTVRDLTHQPDLHGRPSVVQLQLSGALPLQIDATLDHTGDVPQELIVIQCPKLPQSQRVLGREGQLAVTVPPGDAQLEIELRIVGEDLSGRAVWRQEDVRLATQLSDQWGGRELSTGLQRALSDVDRIETNVQLLGTLQKPRFRLQSDLGDQLAGGFRAALSDELARRGEDLQRQADAFVQKQMQSVDSELQNRAGELLGNLQLGQQQIDQFKQQLTSRIGLPDGILGGGSPLKNLNNLFRR